MAISEFPDRSHPPHFPTLAKHNRSTIVFITVCTKDRKRILATSAVMSILMDAWRKLGEWKVGRFVIMPDHVHWFCAPGVVFPCSLRTWVRKWKACASRHWPRREQHPVWQPDFWDRQLRHGESYASKWEYVFLNPVRQGLVQRAEDWPFQGKVFDFAWHD